MMRPRIFKLSVSAGKLCEVNWIDSLFRHGAWPLHPKHSLFYPSLRPACPAVIARSLDCEYQCVMRPETTLFHISRQLALLLLSCVPLICHAQPRGDVGWSNYGNDSGGTRFSPLKQINRTNVERLRVAWTCRTGALNEKSDLNGKATFETTPITVNGSIIFSTPYDQVIAWIHGRAPNSRESIRKSPVSIITLK